MWTPSREGPVPPGDSMDLAQVSEGKRGLGQPHNRPRMDQQGPWDPG